MKSALKILLWLIGVVVVLIVAAAVILPLVIDPNDYRDEIANAVRDQTGRELTIEGDLKLSVFPWLGVSIGRTSLSNDPRFGDTPMLAVEDASVGVRLGALLSRRVEVSEVRLDGLRLNLVRRADGSNWDSLVSESEAPAAPEPDGGPALAFQEIGGVRITDARISIVDDVEKINLETALDKLAVGAIALDGDAVDVDGVQISGAEATYRGAEGNVVFRVANLDTGSLKGGPDAGVVDGVKLGGVDLNYQGGEDDVALKLERLDTGRLSGGPDAVDVDGVKLGGAELDYKGSEGDVALKLEQLDTGRLSGGSGKGTVDGLDLRNMMLAYAAGAERYEARVDRLDTGKVVGDPDAPQIDGLRLAGATFSIAGGESGPVEGTLEQFEIGRLVPGEESAIKGRLLARIGEPVMDVTLDLDGRATVAGQQYTLAGLSAKADLAGEAIPGGKQSLDMRVASVEVDNEAQTFAIKQVKVAFAGMDLTMRANGKQIDTAPDIRGQIDIAEFSPRRLMASLGLEAPVTADSEVLKKASLSSNFRVVENRFNLPNLVATLDDTRLEGQFSMADGEPQVLRATLVVDAIDVDRYLAPEVEGAVKDEATASAEINAEDLRGKDVQADLSIGTVKVSGLTLTDVKTKAVIRDGKLTVAPLGAQLYGGEIAGRMTLDGRTDVPALSLNQTLKTVQLAPLFKDLADVERLTGAANGNLKLDTTGRNSDQMLSALNGEMRFRVDDGALRGINITHSVQAALSLLDGQAPPPKSSPDTEFKQLKITAQVVDGVMRSDDLQASLPNLNVTGAGSVDLAKQSVDYRLVATVPEGQAAKQANLGRLAGKSVPITISGTLDDPSVKADVSALVKDKVQSLIRDQLGLGGDKKDGEQDAGQGDLKDQAQEKLKKLFGK